MVYQSLFFFLIFVHGRSEAGNKEDGKELRTTINMK
jgi:hypothetical protein